MNIGLSTNKWLAVSEGWTPSMRAYALDLLTWAWESRSPLPDNPVTLARLARADDRRSFAVAWGHLSAPNGRGIFVRTEHGFICPLQDEARGRQAAKSRAGKASVAARRLDRRPAAPVVEQHVPTQAEQRSSSTDFHRAVEKTPEPVEKPSGIVENRSENGFPPHPPSLSPGTYVRTSVPDQERSDLSLVCSFDDVDETALTIAGFMLKSGAAYTLDEWRDEALAFVSEVYATMSPAARAKAVDQTVLTYRLWDETFLGSYRDRFSVGPAGITAAGRK